jgi:hypothetical protein
VITHFDDVMFISMPSATVIVFTILVSLSGYTVMVCPMPVGDTPKIMPAAMSASKIAIAVVAICEWRFNLNIKLTHQII